MKNISKLLIFQLFVFHTIICDSTKKEVKPSTICFYIISQKGMITSKKLIDILKKEITKQDEIIVAKKFDKSLSVKDYIFTIYTNEKPSEKLLKTIREIISSKADGYYIQIINSKKSKQKNDEELRIIKNIHETGKEPSYRKKVNININDKNIMIYREDGDEKINDDIVRSYLYQALVYYLKVGEKEPFSVFLKKEGALKIFEHGNIQFIINKEYKKKAENKYIQKQLKKFLQTTPNPSQEQINKIADGIVRLIFS